MPQGGLDNQREDYNLSAMKRELLEETSIRNIKLLKKLMDFLNTNYQKFGWNYMER